MTSEAQLLTSRKTQKGNLTRISTFITRYETNPNIEQVYIRNEKIEEIWTNYNEIQRQLEIINEEDHGDDRESFENQYYETKADLRRIIKEHELRRINTENPDANKQTEQQHEYNTAPSTSLNINLPKMNLPQFSGEYKDWRNFYDTFDAIIHKNRNISNIEKFFYLKSVLKGEALKIISSLPPSSENYNVAFNLLIERYNNNQSIVNAHLNNLFSLPPVFKYSSSSLRALITDAKQQLESLRALELPVESWDTIIIFLLTQKIDFVTRREWELNKTKNELPKLTEFFEFLESRCLSLEAVESPAQSTINKPRGRHTTVSAVSTNTPTYQCHLCNDNHRLYKCEKFHNMDINKRYETVKASRVCFNCLNPGHGAKQCRAEHCKKCGKPHSTFIHFNEAAPTPAPAINTSTTVAPTSENQTVSYVSASQPKQVLLSTAVIRVKNVHGVWIDCRALLDSASQSNFATENLAKKLNVKRFPYNSKIVGISGTISKVNQSINLHISSRSSQYHRELEFLVLDKVACELPNSYVDVSQLNLPKNTHLADPHFNKPGDIDLLIGAEIYLSILKFGQRQLENESLYIQNTLLGWIVSGSIPTKRDQKIVHNSLFTSVKESTDDILRKFWELESIPRPTVKSKEEMECETHFQKTIKRNESGRYIVQLPLREEKVNTLGNSYALASKRLDYIWKRLDSDPKLKEHYTTFMQDYIDLNHMEPIEEFRNSATPPYFIPHHPVVKETNNGTKLRVVFDASMKTDTGVSLNDILKVGATVQPELLSIIMRFRLYEYAFTTDIQKMYRQILVEQHQRNYQLILWKSHSKSKPKIYTLNTVTYGTASAPFLATRCIQHLATEDGEEYPLAKRALLENCYVDDVMAGSNSLNEVLELQRQLIQLLQRGGFTLHKWCANHDNILTSIEPEHRETKLPLEFGKEAVKTLGLLWLPAEDKFKFVIKLREEEETSVISKRTILSNIASIFDPLGLLAPVVVKAKIFMRQLWKQTLSWDEEVPKEIMNEWRRFKEKLHELGNFEIDRKISIKAHKPKYEVHGFSDASTAAYGACIYLKSTNDEGEVNVKLIAAKSRVAPIKPITIPRLELCASVVLVRLLEQILTSMNLKNIPIHLWTDSTIILSWLSSDPSKFKTFVGNRVAEVQELSTNCMWHHISTNENPADHVSRGMYPEELKQNSLWWNGPEWLKQSENEWPINANTNCDQDESEIKTSPRIALVCTTKCEIFDKFSTMPRLQRTTAYVIRFIHNCKNPESKLTGPLCVPELESALKMLIKIAQHEEYSEEINCINNNQPISKSILKNLTPFVDEQGLLRVGGRLQYSKRSYDQRHQIILPRNHKLTSLILENEHKKLLHAGTQTVLGNIREKYWPIQARSNIKRIIHRCIICYRFKAKPCTQLMGNLPSYRTQTFRAFLNSGVDYGGPILIKSSQRKNAPLTKAYIALFICLATRAIHLELVSDLSTQAFISAFKRFVSRRGICQSIHSDNATNFKGAQNEMIELSTFLRNETNKTKIIDEAAMNGTEWKFIPPNAPHFGGIWEAGIKTIKYHLKRVVGNLHLTFEEFYTTLIQIEACVNSRPLTVLSDDPTDHAILTPAHFLIGHPLSAMPEPNLMDLPDTRLSKWQLMQKNIQLFWKKWSRDYLNSLQQRTKWTHINPNIKKGDLVLVMENNQPPLSWPLARVTDVHPGEDGRVRVATITTPSGVYKRPIAKLCLLPVDDNHCF